MGTDKTVLTTGDVARLCGVTIRTVIKWFETGRLEGYRLPGSRERRFPRDAVERFLARNGMPVSLLSGPGAPGATATGGARRILVVDDDAAVRGLVQRYLATLGLFEIHSAGSGWEAGLKTVLVRPDLILLDYRLGDTTGDQVVAMLRSQDLRPRPAILVMSAYLEGHDVERVLALGAEAFLRKPFELEALRDLVLRHAGVLA